MMYARPYNVINTLSIYRDYSKLASMSQGRKFSMYIYQITLGRPQGISPHAARLGSRAGGGHVEDHEQVGEPLRAEEVPRHRRRPQPGRACRGLPAPRLLGAAAREQRERRLVLRRRRLEPVLRDVAHLPAATGRIAVFPLSNLDTADGKSPQDSGLTPRAGGRIARMMGGLTACNRWVTSRPS